MGSTDVNGKGTHSDAAESLVSPFLLMDEARIPADTPLPFSKHPHTGLVANTILLEGHSMLWDNLNGHYGPAWAGGLFQINAGRGVVHDEGAPPPEEVYKANPHRKKAGDTMHAVQLWFNPGIHSDTVLGAQAESVVIAPEDIPALNIEGSTAGRVVIGEYQGVKSPAKTYQADLCVLDLTLPQGGVVNVQAKPGQMCWVYPLMTSNKGVSVTPPGGEAEEDVDLHHIAVLPASEAGGSVRVAAAEGAQVFVGMGAPFEKVPIKLLGHDGAFFGPDESYLNAKLAEFEAQGEAFGK